MYWDKMSKPSFLLVSDSYLHTCPILYFGSEHVLRCATEKAGGFFSSEGKNSAEVQRESEAYHAQCRGSQAEHSNLSALPKA